jgi:hypothetical protein
MNKAIILLVLGFLSIKSFSQVKKEHYQQFDISLPFRGNNTYGQIDNYGNRSDYWFLPNGLSLKYGVGVYQKKWLALGMHSGINWILSDKIVTVPVFINFRLSPKIGYETRLYFQGGFGKSIVIGRGSLMGEYKKVSLGIENSDGVSIFVELEDHHGFSFGTNGKVVSFSLGLSLITF